MMKMILSIYRAILCEILYLKIIGCLIHTLKISQGFHFARNMVVRPALFGVSLALVMTSPAVSEHAYQDILQVFLKDGRLLSFSLKDLESFPQITFKSSSPWTEGVHEFTGIPLKSLVEQFDPSFTQIGLTARDNYQVTFAAEDLTDTWPILAIYMNGDPISPRTKGPFWVVFPFDDYPELQREDLYARSIWQVQHLKIE